MFWACEVTETKAAVVDVPEGVVLNVCNATSSVASSGAQVALGLETQQLDGKAWKGAVAHLGGSQPLQVKLELVFGHKVKFYLAQGSGAVNLTGYFQPGPMLEQVEAPKAVDTKASKKRAREEKKAQDEVSSNDSEEVVEKKAKADKPAATAPPAKKEEQKKTKPAETPANNSTNDAAPMGTSGKKKRKKKNKKVASNGEAK